MDTASKGALSGDFLTTSAAARVASDFIHTSAETVRVDARRGLLPAIVTPTGTRVYVRAHVVQWATARARRQAARRGEG